MDRLLSPQEIASIKPGHNHIKRLLQNQRDLTAKAVNEDWVKWVSDAITNCGTHECSCYKDCYISCDGFSMFCLKGQERKKECGL